MKILAICPRIPEIGKKGDQVLSFYRLSYLARTHNIQLICFGDPIKDLHAKLELEACGIKVNFVKWNIVTALSGLLYSIFDSKLPMQCSLFKSRKFKLLYSNLMYDFKPDAIYAVTIRALENLTEIRVPLFIDLVDSMALNFERRVNASFGFYKLILKSEYARVRRYERIFSNISSRSFIVSSIDKNVIDCDKISVIPLGIDENIFFKSRNESNNPSIVFTGNMNYTPNVEAVMWFYYNCWNIIKTKYPNSSFIIAGGSPNKEILALQADKSVTITGRVSSLAAIINTAWVSIAPMQSGSGMQFKILEAMACGVPVITSSLGLGDIKAAAGRDLFVTDSSNRFVEIIFSLFNSIELRKKVGDAGLHYVKSNHTWDVLNADFESQLINNVFLQE